MRVEHYAANAGAGAHSAAFVRLTPLDPKGGATQTDFAPEIDTILIGRDAAWTRDPATARKEGRFIYPDDAALVGGRHLLLKREPSGSWSAYSQRPEDGNRRYAALIEHTGLLGRTWLEPVEGKEDLHSGAILRLGNREGPRLRFDIVGAPKRLAGAVTEDQWKWLTQRQRLRRLTATVAGLAAVTVIGLSSLGFFTADLHGRVVQLGGEVAGLREDFRDEIDEKIAAAQKPTPDFSVEVRNMLRDAAHVIKVRNGDSYTAIATAWPVSPTQIVTNAHVATQVGDRDIVVCKPFVENVCYEVVGGPRLHPAYDDFKSYLEANRYGVRDGEEFRESSFPGAYDLAVYDLAPGSDAGPTLSLATPEELSKLNVGDPVAFAGYLLRDVDDAQDAQGAIPTPHLQFGTVSAMTNFFMFAADGNPQRGQLVHTSIPVTGGASGGPVINSDGKVVAILSSGTVSSGSAGTDGPAPSAVLVNYAQRVDLLSAFMSADETATQAIRDGERTYWDEQVKRFVNYHAYLLSRMEKPDVYDARKRTLAPWLSLTEDVAAQHDVTLVQYSLEKGRRYRFLAYAMTDDTVELKVEFDNQKAKQSDIARGVTVDFVPKQDGVATVTVSTSSREQTSFELVVYRSED
ncbi:MAG: trypsin-like peptidase domain-containing protein [Rhizobiaceae bacterium]|nr:trypsin-like peptidase domain-containing protein [Rhizobiaceae bacterium]